MSDPLTFVLDPVDGAAARDLYARPPGEFVAARSALQKAARADGRRDVATLIGKLRRPTVAEHALNLAAREANDLVAQLRTAHEAATTAQAAAITGDAEGRSGLRAATTAVRAARSALVGAAAAIVGAGPGDARTNDIDAVVQRVIASGTWDVLVAGVLGADPGGESTDGPDDGFFPGVPDDAVLPVVSVPARTPRPGKPARRTAAPTARTPEPAARSKSAPAESPPTKPPPDKAAASDVPGDDPEEAARQAVAAAEVELAATTDARDRARHDLKDADRALAAAVEAQRLATEAVREAEAARDAAAAQLMAARGRGGRTRRRL